MKVSLSWLQDFLETTATVPEISETLSSLGLVVDAVTNPADALRGFIVAEVTAVEPHPDADSLQVCRVETGKETLQVVCGADNPRPGLKVVLASPGITMPGGGPTLRITKIRGVESFGMLCSLSELGLGEDTQGHIFELPAEAPVGKELVDFLNLDDPVFDIDVTPNRGDCFAVQGIARELAAAGLGTLKAAPQEAQEVRGVFPCPVTVSLEFQDHEKEACPHFMGRVIRGVRNGPSPDWLQNKLKAVGVRPVSSLVDITNYMALSYARPMHVFDVDKLGGMQLTVKPASGGESFLALDEREYALTSGMTVICDQDSTGHERIISLAGVMGGETTGCDDNTTTVFLESAYFSPESIAKTGQSLGVLSDARTRFERGVDPAFVEGGLHKATQLILDLCGGEPSDVTSAGMMPDRTQTVPFSVGAMKAYTGVEVEKSQACSYLESLGCRLTTSHEGSFQVQTPSWRHDLTQENDLIEEVLRLKGYDSIPQTPLPPVSPEEFFESKKGARSRQNRLWVSRRALAGLGFCEVMTWSFLKKEEAVLFGGGEPSMVLDNPISQDMSTMRPSLLPGLIRAAGRNQDRGQAHPSLFEVGASYRGPLPEDQKTGVAGVRAGKSGPRHWRDSSDPVSLYTIKEDVISVLESCGLDPDKAQILEGAASYFHPGRSARFCLGPKICLAQFGELHPKVLKELEVSGPVVGFEIFLDALPVSKEGPLKKPLELSPYQPVERDLAFILDQSVSAQTVIQTVKKTERHLITSVEIFDDYRGQGVPAGHKSLGLTFRLEPQDKTLTDEDIHRIMNQVITNVEQATGGTLRS